MRTALNSNTAAGEEVALSQWRKPLAAIQPIQICGIPRVATTLGGVIYSAPHTGSGRR